MSEIKFRKPLECISPYVPGKPIDDVKRELGLTHVVKLASNENPYGCSPRVKEAVSKALETPALYPDGNCTILRQMLAKKHEVKPEQLVFGAGSNEIISFIAQIYINAGDESIMPTPSFLWYEIAVRTMDGVVIDVPLKDYTHDLDAMREKITEKTKIMWLCNPNNPTGTVFSKTELQNFLDNVPSDIIVVLDEAYYEYVDDESYPQSIPLISKYPNIIVLRTFSKAFGLASFRVGYAVCSEEVAGYLNRVRPPFNVNSLAQVAAVESIEDSSFFAECARKNREGMLYLYSALEEMGLTFIRSQTNFLMVNVKQSGQEVFKKLLQKGVIVRFDKGFGMPEWIRVTVGTMDENKLFINALKEVLA